MRKEIDKTARTNQLNTFFDKTKKMVNGIFAKRQYKKVNDGHKISSSTVNEDTKKSHHNNYGTFGNSSFSNN